jgi:hypothetical protein
MNTTKALLAGAALAGLIGGSTVHATEAGKTSVKSATAGLVAADKSTDVHSCKGKNSCKGKGGCKTGDNGCKGKNSCKGKGGCKTTKSSV